jgi:hypothetical protein
MSSVFLSHSHADKEFVRKLAADLRLAGHTVWIDEAEINVGDSLIAKLREGLDQVDYVAAIVSAASVASEWVTRELDIASNRELREKRVVVLPVLIEKVRLPGFLDGKFYADFTDSANYRNALGLLLRALGDATPVPKPAAEELARLKAELQAAHRALAAHEAEARVQRQALLRAKSPRLQAAIAEANARFPAHAPINNAYAFESGTIPVTLDYLMWGIAKAERTGSHVLEVSLTLNNKWAEVEAMVQAYKDLLAASGED